MHFIIVTISFFLTNSVCCFNFFDNYEQVKFFFIHGNSPNHNTIYSFGNISSLVNHPRFDSRRPTVMYCHGWVGDFNVDSAQLVAKAYIQRNDHNIIVLDWGQYSVTLLPSALIRSVAIAKLAGQSLVKTFQLGLDANKLHCVGHSIGAHICGIMGREVALTSRGRLKIKRITGLDPSFRFYYRAIAGELLSKRDAQFVDIIHTDTFMAGTPYSIGHVDFFPNNGKLQGGCRDVNIYDLFNNYCSHHISYVYYTESLLQSKLYPAKQCKSWNDFKSRKCDRNPTNYMGYEASPAFEGKFFNEISRKRNVYFENFDIYGYVSKAFAERSDLGKLWRKFRK